MGVKIHCAVDVTRYAVDVTRYAEGENHYVVGEFHPDADFYLVSLRGRFHGHDVLQHRDAHYGHVRNHCDDGRDGLAQAHDGCDDDGGSHSSHGGNDDVSEHHDRYGRCLANRSRRTSDCDR